MNVMRAVRRLSLSSLLVVVALLGASAGARAAWFDEDWSNRMPISLDSAQVTAVLSDFPVLVDTSDEEGFVRDNLANGVAQANGEDIVFTAGDGETVLAHEIERYDADSGQLIAWVRVSELDPDQNTALFIYYGNEDSADMQQREAVWSNGYRMVQHLQEPGGNDTVIGDSSGNGTDGRAVADAPGRHPRFLEDGWIDGAREPRGGNQRSRLEVPHQSALNITGEITVEAWARIDSDQEGPDHHPVLWKGERIGWGANYHFRIAVVDGNQMTWGVTCGSSEVWQHAGAPQRDEWAHYALVLDRSTNRLRGYINGQQVMNRSGCGGTALNTFSDRPVLSGWGERLNPSDDVRFSGGVDEMRISATRRSPQWLETQYNNQDAPASFHTFGQEQGDVADLMISYWFDEDWADNNNDIPDRSGSARTGSANGVDFRAAGDESAVPGSPGTCGFVENPAGGNVTAPTDEEINEADSFTSSFWLRMTEDEQNNDAPSLLTGGNLEDFFAERFEVLADFRFSRRDLLFFVRQDGGPSPQRLLSWTPSEGAANDPFSGNWVHITVRHDAPARLMRLYANGSLVAENDYGGGPARLVDATGPIQKGGFSSGVAPAALDHDEFRFVGRALSEDDIQTLFQEQRQCADTLAELRINVAEFASVCEAEPVELTALDDNGNVISNYSGTVDLSTSSNRGNWALVDGEGTLSPDPHTANDGAASYSFVEDDEGSVMLELANESADELTISASDTDAGVTSTSDPVQFQENAFVVTVTDALGEDFVAGRDHGARVEAIRRDPDTGECGLISDYDGNIDLKGWIERTADDPGGASPSIADGAGSDTLPDAEPAGNNMTLAFDQGAADVAWETTDVGQYALNVRDDSSGIVVDEEGDPIPVTGAGQTWTVRPFGFHVRVVGNPAADSAAGPAFQAAGQPFDVEVSAVAYDPADDSTGDGVPDGHTVADPAGQADLSDNPTTLAFGNGPTPEVDVTADLVAGPTSPSDPGLTDPVSIDSFSDGEATASASYPEVGSISLLADIGGSYLGRATTVIGRSDYVGRFHPELFTVQAVDGSFEPECNGFVYSGEEHGYDLVPELEITPRRYDDSGTGALVSNYRGDWQLLTAGDIDRLFPDEDDDNGLAVTINSVTGTLDPEGDGRMTYYFGDDEYTYVKDEDARVDPFTSDLLIQVTDIDDGDAQLDPDQNPVEITPEGVEIRYGRLRLDNTFGPEILDLIVPMRAEYWESERFRLNIDEGGPDCWEYNTEDDVLLDQSGLSGGSTSVVPVEDTLVAGEPMEGSELTLTAPGDGNTGQVGVDFMVPIWLQDDFDGDGTLQNPTATATFGVFRGHDRIIHWREVR